MTIFETVKAAVTPKMAAERYGLHVNQNGMTLLLVNDTFGIYDLSYLAGMRTEDVMTDLRELKRRGYLQCE